jgi:hypothetical protein
VAIRASQGAGLEPEAPVHGRVARLDARPGELDQPANVFGRHEVPGVAQHVRAKELPVCKGAVDVRFGKAAGALADGPPGDGILLGLHGAEPADDLGGAAERSADQALVDQPPARYLAPWVGHREG